MKTTVKKVFESDSWIITKVLQGYDGQVRIDAKRRFPVADEPSFFSEWCTKKYADRLSIDSYGKPVDKLNAWSY